MRYYPAYLDLRDCLCVVIGGGAVAERKTLSLLEASAAVTVISPTLTPRLRELSEAGAIRHLQKAFDEQDLDNACLVIAATDAPEVNRSAARACRKKRVLVNVAAPPEEGNFIVPSTVARGELLIAVSTGGASPALSRKIRQELEKHYGPEYGLFLQKLTAVRQRILENISDENERRNIFQALVDSDILGLLRQGKIQDVESRIAELAGLKRRPSE